VKTAASLIGHWTIQENEIHIEAKRIGTVPGTHTEHTTRQLML
jgi:hypothetical protein